MNAPTPAQVEALGPLLDVVGGALTSTPVRLGSRDGAAELAADITVKVAAYVMGEMRPLVDENARLKARVAELEKDSALLAALYAGGVDNWDGYSGAVEAAAS